ncbi:class II glutamine amidotransferase [Desulfogranum marinum]|uniref:class II glutamine amidotransferase n=1 Tax=Desulfogranum marinum TaxID=453220 RepID=UPI001963AD3B|nr:class II glutamine amidotransferase [Desulfogranum marinum]MBM9514692.1 class II glutamine amidotransferase [Desulfogranum marinum]
MCELLALNFNKPIQPKFSFPSLLLGCDWNPDGWGIGYHPDGKGAVVFKEPVPGNESELAAFLQHSHLLKSETFILHIRRASRGMVSYENTHPFFRHYCGTEMIFAHNGTLVTRTPLNINYQVIGNTDSEQAFCTLLGEMEKKDIIPRRRGGLQYFSDENLEKIYEILFDINRHGAFNCIFSDGFNLFAYRDKKGARDLHYVKREYPFSSCRFRDSDIGVDLNVHKGSDESGYIIASNPLSDEEWEEFNPGQMIVFSRGKQVASILSEVA